MKFNNLTHDEFNKETEKLFKEEEKDNTSQVSQPKRGGILGFVIIFFGSILGVCFLVGTVGNYVSIQAKKNADIEVNRMLIEECKKNNVQPVFTVTRQGDKK